MTFFETIFNVLLAGEVRLPETFRNLPKLFRIASNLSSNFVFVGYEGWNKLFDPQPLHPEDPPPPPSQTAFIPQRVTILVLLCLANHTSIVHIHYK